jgi:glutamate dehydrogenase
VLRSQTYWLARRAAKDRTGIEELTLAYRPAADALKKMLPEVLSPFAQKEAVRRAAGWIKAGAPKTLAHAIVLYRSLAPTVSLADLAADLDWPVAPVARIYHAVGGVFGFDRLRAAAIGRVSADAYERLALRRLLEDMLGEQANLTRAVMAYAGRPEAGETAEAAKAAISSWSALNAEPVRLAKSIMSAIEKEGGGWSFAKLTVANAALRELA